MAKARVTKGAAKKPRSKKTSLPPETGDTGNLSWAKNPDWTWKVIEYLTDHADFRIKLFSDSSADAAKEGRDKKTSKDGKPQMFGTLARAVFEEDPVQKDAYKAKPSRFTTSVETRLRRLKAEYIGYLKEIGQTGAGLASEDVTEGSPLANLIAGIVAKWPWWHEFHAFWRELPNYNPIGVENSDPGVDHALEAANIFEPAAERDNQTTKQQEEDGSTSTDDDHGGASGRNDVESDGDEEADGNDDDSTEERPSTKGEIPEKLKEEKLSIEDKKPAVVKKGPILLGGRDTGLVKARESATKNKVLSVVKHQTAADKFNDFRAEEAKRLIQKRQMDHELAMAHAQNKRIKYEFKQKAAEADRASRIEELKLQIQLAQITAGIQPQSFNPPAEPPLFNFAQHHPQPEASFSEHQSQPRQVQAVAGTQEHMTPSTSHVSLQVESSPYVYDGPSSDFTSMPSSDFDQYSNTLA